MLKWYKMLYVGNNSKKKASKARWKLDHGKLQTNMYLVTYAQNPENLLEIIGTEQLMQKTVYRRCPEIVGLAASYKEAVSIVQQIIEETYRKQGNTDVRKYLSSRLKESKNKEGE